MNFVKHILLLLILCQSCRLKDAVYCNKYNGGCLSIHGTRYEHTKSVLGNSSGSIIKSGHNYFLSADSIYSLDKLLIENNVDSIEITVRINEDDGADYFSVTDLKGDTIIRKDSSIVLQISRYGRTARVLFDETVMNPQTDSLIVSYGNYYKRANKSINEYLILEQGQRGKPIKVLFYQQYNPILFDHAKIRVRRNKLKLDWFYGSFYKRTKVV